jgi:hypothetical protein
LSAHDKAIAASSVMNAMLDAEQLQTEPRRQSGMKRAYNEDEDKQPDIYDVYPPIKKRRLNDKEEDDSSDDDELPILIDDSHEDDDLTKTNTVADPNLMVTFSDNESVGGTDIVKYRKRDSLPFLDYFASLSMELIDSDIGLQWDHDYDSASYWFDHDIGITIARPVSMEDIKDHPSSGF